MDHTRSYLLQYNQLFKETDDIYRKAARKFDLPETAFWILYFLRTTDRPCTQRDLCGKMMQSKQSVNTALKKLEAEDCIRLAFAENSRKYKTIYLTETGLALAAATAEKIIRAEEAAFAKFSDEKSTQLLRLFGEYICALRREMDDLGSARGMVR